MADWHLNAPRGLPSISWKVDLSNTAENLENLRKMFYSTTAPVNPVAGQLWAKNTGSDIIELYVYNGSHWVSYRDEITELGGVRKNTRTITSDSNADDTDTCIWMDATNGEVTLTLPDPSDREGKVFICKKIDSSENVCYVSSANTIDGLSVHGLSVQYDNITVISGLSVYYKI